MTHPHRRPLHLGFRYNLKKLSPIPAIFILWLVVGVIYIHVMSQFRDPTPSFRNLQQNTGSPILAQDRDVIVVTGGAHNIGRHLIETLSRGASGIISRPVTLVVLDSADAPEGSNGESIFSHLSIGQDVKVQMKQVDIVNYHAVLHALAPFAAHIRGIIHLAAVSRVQDCHQNLPRCMEVNVGGTKNIMRVLSSLSSSRGQPGAKDGKPKPWMLFASSREVYGSLGPDEVVDETSPLSPLNIYGETKMKAEMAIQHWARKTGFNAVVLRFNNVYGGCHDHGTRLVPIMIDKLVSGDQFFITNSVGKTLSMVHIDDVVQAIILGAKFAETLQRSSGVFEEFNIGGGPTHDVINIKDMYHMAQTAVATVVPECARCFADAVVNIPKSDRSPEPEHFRSYINKASMVLGYKPTQRLNEKTLRRYIDTCVLPDQSDGFVHSQA